MSSLEQIKTLIEALPYMQQFKGCTVVIKYGGHAMINQELKEKVLQDIMFLQFAGIKPVIVHGGGPEITSMLKQVGKQSEFVNGLRITDVDTMEIAEMVLVGKINGELVSMLNRLGTKAVGLSGKDGNLMSAKKMLVDIYSDGEVQSVDIGYVGEIEEINIGLLNILMDNGYVPIIAPIGAGVSGESYNMNADSVAGEIASALKAEKLLLLTDTKGIYRDFGDENSFISTLTFEEAQELMNNGKIDGGMIPKVKACVSALDGGAKKTHIIDGRQHHAILLEVFTDAGIGTEVIK
mgnify:CR=1 FL=1